MVFARAVNNGFAWLSSLEMGVLQSAVNIPWVGGPLDIVHNGSRRLSCAFGDADIASPAKLKGEKREERERGGGFWCERISFSQIKRSQSIDIVFTKTGRKSVSTYYDPPHCESLYPRMFYGYLRAINSFLILPDSSLIRIAHCS